MANDQKRKNTARFGAGMQRREFLKIMGGAAALGAGFAPFSIKTACAQSYGAGLPHFVDALPIPDTISPVGSLRGDPLYNVVMREFMRKLHRDLPPTTLWGYNGMYPGPTFEARTGTPIAVQWNNDLPTKHPLTIDPGIHGTERGTPEVRTVVHLHGAKVMPDSDGYPEAWFTNGFAQTGPFFSNRVYHYPNDQPATALWYHDHALGATRLNMHMGLAGFYLLRDASEDALDLPKGAYEIPLVIQDRLINADGSLLYPDTGQAAGDPEILKFWIPEFFGDTVLVNGKVWPFLEVEPRKYRFRILNASNAAFYALALAESTAVGEMTGNPGPSFTLIGTDGGFVPHPVKMDQVTIAPSERYDVVIDFSGAEGKSFLLRSDAKEPFPDGDDEFIADVMLFKVTKRLNGRDTSKVPSNLPAVPPLHPRDAVKVRDLVLIENASAQDNVLEGLINAHWTNAVTEAPRAGATEIWRVINTTEDAHPIHVHLVQFNILDRQAFDPAQYPGRLVFTGPRVPAPADERHARKDVVKAFPGEVARVIARFDLPQGARVSTGQKHRYVFHCHILEHEDNDMMRPYDVVG